MGIYGGMVPKNSMVTHFETQRRQPGADDAAQLTNTMTPASSGSNTMLPDPVKSHDPVSSKPKTAVVSRELLTKPP